MDLYYKMRLTRGLLQYLILIVYSLEFIAISNAAVTRLNRTLLLPLSLQPTMGFGLSNKVLPFFPICHHLSPSSHSQHLKICRCCCCCSSSSSSSSSSSPIGTTAHCGLWPVEQCPSMFSYLPPTLSIFSLSALEHLFLLPISIFSWDQIVVHSSIGPVLD